ncbi:hypothetical protein C8J57DRAFT_1539524 [Mycena rebaudengoi]|nr:hypothetical protein C8J57DRAFT_1539524 [Mycena rebaudengoi]
MSPVGAQYSPSSRNMYSPTSPGYVPQSLFGDATSPFGTSLYATSPFYDRGARGPSSPTEPAVSPHFPIVFSEFAAVQPVIAVVQPHITPVLSDEPVVQPGVATILQASVLYSTSEFH